MALQLPGMVALDKELRDASSDAEKLLEEFEVEMSMRKDLFDVVLAFSKSEEAKTLSPELKRYVEKQVSEELKIHIISFWIFGLSRQKVSIFILQVNDGMRNGLHLDEAKREEIKTVKKRISELGVEFNKNLNEDTTFLLLDQTELTGVPEDLVGSFEKDEDSGKLKVTMKYPHFFPVTRYRHYQYTSSQLQTHYNRKCNNPETRLRMEKTYQSRCMAENTKIIEEIVSLRQKQSQLLGYENHAAYIQEVGVRKSNRKTTE